MFPSDLVLIIFVSLFITLFYFHTTFRKVQPEPADINKTFLMPLLVMAYCIFFFTNVLVMVDSTNIWWHLHIGREIASTLTIPRTDTLTFLGEGRPYFDSHWLFQLMMHYMTLVFGEKGMTLYQAMVFGFMFIPLLFIHQRIRNTPSMLLVTIVIASIGICAISVRFMPRPEAVAYLSIATFILFFEFYRVTGSRIIYWIPLISILSVNCHALFAVGYFVIGAYLVESILAQMVPNLFDQRLKIRPIATVLVLSIMAYFLNPHGLDTIKYAYMVSTEVGDQAHPLMKSLVELKPTFSAKNMQSFSFPFYLLLALLSTLTLFAGKRKTSPAQILILIVLFYFSISAYRNMALFASAATPIIIFSLLNHRWTFRPVLLKILLVIVCSVLILQSGRLVTGRHYQAQGLYKKFGMGVLENIYPAGAVQFTKEHKPLGNLGHFDPFGGYYLYSLAPLAYKYLYDGRFEVFDQDLLYNLFMLLDHPSKYLHALEPYNVNLYILDYTRHVNQKLLAYLYTSPDWVLLYFDHISALFVRDIPEHQDLIQKERIQIAEAIAGLEFNQEDLKHQKPQSIVNFLTYIGEKKEAMALATKILHIIPGDSMTTEVLVENLLQEGKLHEAEPLIDKALARKDQSAYLHSQKSYILFTRSDLPGAIDHMMKAVKLKPENAGFRYNLALLYYEVGDLNHASKQAGKVEQLDPGHKGLAFLKKSIETAKNAENQNETIE